jgi:hypothetical protein
MGFIAKSILSLSHMPRWNFSRVGLISVMTFDFIT